MHFLLGIFTLIIGFVLGFKFSRIKKTKESATDERQPMYEGYNLNSSLGIKDKNLVRLDSATLEKKILYDQELALLFKTAQELLSSLKLEDICRIIVENVKKVLNVEKCALLLLSPRTNRLQIEYSIGLTQEEIKNSDIKNGESISGWVASSNEMVFIRDIEKDYWIKMMNKEKYYTKSLVSIPLSMSSKVFGVLNVNNKITAEQFSEDDLKLLKGIASQGAAAIQNAKLYEELQEGYFRTIIALAAALDTKDQYTYRHAENVTRYAIAIAKELKLNDIEIENIRRCGLLHDIGKIGISDGILSSPEKLTEQEFEQIKEHPAKGEEIIGSLPFLKEIALYVRHHHERFDGKGYPDGQRGHQIGLPARILAVCDAFDAMISNRPYRDALSIKEACEELKRCSSTQFDSDIVDVFLRILEKNPDVVKR